MPTLTLFTTPKPFTDPHIAAIQENALRSWMQLGEEVEVVLIGWEAGLAEIASKLQLRHLPDVTCNDQGTPLISSIFDLARRHSRSPYLAYANADILFLADFLTAVRRVAQARQAFLMVGRRWNLDVSEPLVFSPGWQERLTADVWERGQLYTHTGIDYFVFPRDQFAEMPAFAVGRAVWDNWMIYHGRASGWMVIDATPSILAVHQNHDYSHLKGGQSLYRQGESLENKRLAGGNVHIYHLLDTNRELIGGRIRRPPLTLIRLLRQLERPFLTNDMTGRRWWVAIRFRIAQLWFLEREQSRWRKLHRYQQVVRKDKTK